MNFLNRRMFANGGGVVPIGDFEIRDRLTGEILIDLSQQPNFINTPGFNPYKILNDDSLEKGSAVLSILQRFKERDAPQIGPFQAQEDLGTNLVDLGFGIARATEPLVRGASRLAGETFGIQPLKEFGGKQVFDPSIEGPVPRVDLFKPTYESYVPTDQDRSRGMIALLKASGKLREQDLPKQIASSPKVSSATDAFFSGLRSIDEKASDVFGTDRIFSDVPQDEIQDFQSEINEFVGPTRPDQKVITESETLGQLSPEEARQKRIDFEKSMLGKDEFGELLPEGRLSQNEEINNLLQEITPAEVIVNTDKTTDESKAEVEEKFDGLEDDELKNIVDAAATPKLPDIERPETDTTILEEDTLGTQPDSVSQKLAQPGFFGSDRFLNFIRNVGGELVRTGQFGEGLASGAAKAAEERAARELMADQERRKFLKDVELEEIKARLEGASGPSDSMKKELRKVSQEMNADYNDIVSAKNTLEIVGRVEEIINNQDTTSVKAFVGELFEKGEALFDIDGKPSKSGKSFADLEPRTRAKVLLNQIKQKNIRDILGESGKTISNLDRQIVEDLVGSISLGKTPQETLEALKITKASIFNNLDAAQNRLKTNALFAQDNNGLYLIAENNNIINYLRTGVLPTTEYNSGFENQSVTKITLEG